MLKLASPELERMIIAQNGLVTTTPTPSGILPHYFLKQESEVTEEQEQYARGFVDALNQLHQTNGYQERQHHNGINSNNNSSNHQNNSHQQNNHSISHNNNTIHSSSDSSSDLTIAEHNSNNNNNSCNNNSNNRLNNNNNYLSNTSNRNGNNFSSLIPTSVPTTDATTFTANKFAIPSIPPQEQQYINISQTNGGEVIINNTSVLPPYSAAVNNNCKSLSIFYSLFY